MSQQGVNLRLGELAEEFGLELRGDPDIKVDHVAPLDQADQGAVAFLNSAKFRNHLASTKASAVILRVEDADDCPTAALITSNPYLSFARIAARLHPQPPAQPGVHPTAFVDPSAQLGEGVSVGPQAVILAEAKIGRGTVIAAGAHVGRGASLGSDCRIGPQVVIGDGVLVGDRAVMHPGAVIGADGFGFANDGGAWVKVPQLGTVRIGNDVEIGANTCVDCGALGDTVIDDGVKLDNLVHVAHNCHIGAHTVVAACTGIAGSTTIGKHCTIAGMVGVAGHLSICDGVTVMGMTRISHSIKERGAYGGGTPMAPLQAWRKNAVRFNHLDEMYRRLRDLEAELGELKASKRTE